MRGLIRREPGSKINKGVKVRVKIERVNSRRTKLTTKMRERRDTGQGEEERKKKKKE